MGCHERLSNFKSELEELLDKYRLFTTKDIMEQEWIFLTKDSPYSCLRVNEVFGDVSRKHLSLIGIKPLPDPPKEI